MIVVDTSAIVSVLFQEADASAVEHCLAENRCVMSAATRVELGIVVEAKKGPAGTQLLDELLGRLGVELVDVTAAQAFEAMVAWRRFGKGRHPAKLNLGDTFSYALARELGQPLLYVGADFAQTDVEAAI